VIIGIGIDIVDLDRIRALLERHGQRFTGRIYTSGEIAYCTSRKRSDQHFAARFAAKEAAFKAFGTGLREGIVWKDVEVVNEPSGKPGIRLSGRSAERAREMGISRMLVSLSHCDCHAAAVVIAQGPEPEKATELHR